MYQPVFIVCAIITVLGGRKQILPQKSLFGENCFLVEMVYVERMLRPFSKPKSRISTFFLLIR